MCLNQLVGLLRSTFVSEIVEIDRQKRGPLPDIGLAVLRGIGFKNFRCHDIFPAVVFKIDCHLGLLGIDP